MIYTNTKQHYEQMLGLTAPWVVSDINLSIENLNLTLEVTTVKGVKLPCPVCGILCPKEDHLTRRSWRHLDTMQFETVIKCSTPRIKCSKHGVKAVEVPWANRYSRYTYLFEHFAIDILQGAKNIESAKKILRLSWKQVQNIQERAVERGLTKRKEDEIKHLGIDEKSFLKGHSYVSILNDLNKGRVIDVIEGRTTESATTLINNSLTKKQKEKVEAIAMDMWDSFMNAAREILPQADIVHDKYHVAGYLGKAVDSVRKSENKFMLKTKNNTLVGSKYLWLTNPENMSKKAKKSFKKFTIDELKVGRAWSIKEAFRHFWYYSYEGSAKSFFKKWYFWATHSKLKPIIKSAKTIKRHFKGIIAYLKHHITNAVSEGLNSKIQSIKANARGFRNFQNYRIAILFNCGKLELYP